MTLEELIKMPVGTSSWDKDIQKEITRVPGGWIYSSWNEHEGTTYDPVFVPELPTPTWYVTDTLEVPK